MKQITLEQYLSNPAAIDEINASARRARAKAIHDLVVRVIHRLTPRVAARPWGLHWG